MRCLKHPSPLTSLGVLTFIEVLRIQSCFAQLKTAVLEDSEFLFFNEVANFQDADLRCQSFSGNLARISNEQEFSFVLEQFSIGLNLQVFADDFWIGTR